MALLTKDNLMAPLTNTTNLLTILCVTVVFAAFRLSGGSFTKDERPRQEQSSEPTLGSTGSLSDHQDYSSRKTSPQDSLAEKSKEKKPTESSPDNSNGGLEEIERAIGLR
jgi:hypothetical protein